MGTPVDIVGEHLPRHHFGLFDPHRLARSGTQITVGLVAYGNLVFLGNTQQHSDHAHWQHRRQLGDDIEPLETDQRIETADAVGAHLILEQRHAFRSEDPRQQPAMARMHGWVFPHDDACGYLNVGTQHIEQVAPAVREDLPVHQGLLDVFVTGKGPEVVPLVVVDRRLFTKPLVRRIGISVDVDVVGVEIDVGIACDHRTAPI